MEKILNLFQWTYGVSLLQQSDEHGRLPAGQSAGGREKNGNNSGKNTPIAMFTVGIYLAQTDVIVMFRKPRLYLVSAVRMLIVPAATMLVLCLVPADMLQMKLAILIAVAGMLWM